MKFILTAFLFVLMPLKAMHLAPRLASRSAPRLIVSRPSIPRSSYGVVVAPKERHPLETFFKYTLIALCSYITILFGCTWNQSKMRSDESVPDSINAIDLYEYSEHFEDVENILDAIETAHESRLPFSDSWRAECMQTIVDSSIPPELKLNLWLVVIDSNLRDKSRFRSHLYSIALKRYLDMTPNRRNNLLENFKDKRPFFELIYKLRLDALEKSIQNDCKRSGLSNAKYRKLLESFVRTVREVKNNSEETQPHSIFLLEYKSDSCSIQACLESSIASIRQCERDLLELSAHMEVPLNFPTA